MANQLINCLTCKAPARPPNGSPESDFFNAGIGGGGGGGAPPPKTKMNSSKLYTVPSY